MLTKQKPTKNITSKSRTTELFNAPKIIKIGSRSSEDINFPRSVFFLIKKSQRVQEMNSIFKGVLPVSVNGFGEKKSRKNKLL